VLYISFNQDPKIYVKTIIQVHARFLKIVKEAFCSEHGYESEHGYKAALDNVKISFLLYLLYILVISRFVENSLIIMQLHRQLVVRKNHLNY